jgi:hypothetical protein
METRPWINGLFEDVPLCGMQMLESYVMMVLTLLMSEPHLAVLAIQVL